MGSLSLCSDFAESDKSPNSDEINEMMGCNAVARCSGSPTSCTFGWIFRAVTVMGRKKNTLIGLLLAATGFAVNAQQAPAQTPFLLAEPTESAGFRTVSLRNDQGTTAASQEALTPINFARLSDSQGCDGDDWTGCDDIRGNCCSPWWAHRTGVFGEWLYLTAGGTDTQFAIEQNGTNAAASPTGPVGRTNIGAHAGVRVGLSLALSEQSSLGVSYAYWHGDTHDSIVATGNNVLNSSLIHPSTATVGATSLEANADQSINFHVVDSFYRQVYCASDRGVINWNLGLRYANLEQGLTGRQTVSVATGLTTVDTDVDFDGIGIVAGLDGERRFRQTGLLVYGKVLGSLLAGEWKADYRQTNQFGGGVIANRYEDFRVSPVIDTELGVGWAGGTNDCFRVTTGFLFSSWFNTVNNRDYIDAVRAGDYVDLEQSITFSGLTVRGELRF